MVEAPGSSSFGCVVGGGVTHFALGGSDCSGTAAQLANPLNVNGLALTATAQTLTTGSGADTISLTIDQPITINDHITAGTAVYEGRVEHTITATG